MKGICDTSAVYHAVHHEEAMTKNELIDKLQAISGNPEIRLVPDDTSITYDDWIERDVTFTLETISLKNGEVCLFPGLSSDNQEDEDD